jgi:putative redox protein
MSTQSGHIIGQATAEIGAARYATALRSGRHALVADEPVEAGGGDAGPSPFGLLLSGLGACTAITLRMYGERKGWPLGEVQVDLTCHWQGERLVIDRTLHVAGALDDAQRARLVEIAAKTPVTRALSAGAEIRTALR